MDYLLFLGKNISESTCVQFHVSEQRILWMIYLHPGHMQNRYKLQQRMLSQGNLQASCQSVSKYGYNIHV